jgi:hypothetical protein
MLEFYGIGTLDELTAADAAKLITKKAGAD